MCDNLNHNRCIVVSCTATVKNIQKMSKIIEKWKIFRWKYLWEGIFQKFNLFCTSITVKVRSYNQCFLETSRTKVTLILAACFVFLENSIIILIRDYFSCIWKARIRYKNCQDFKSYISSLLISWYWNL